LTNLTLLNRDQIYVRITSEEKANGWIVKTKADYLRSSHGVNPVYVGE
jgi:hypothetical protein